MKIKTFITLVLVVVIIFIIYILNVDNKIYYVNIGSNIKYNKIIKNKLNNNKELEKYTNYQINDYRITDLINDINNNKIINDNQTLQNALIKADILTLKIGDDELKYKAKEKNVNDMFEYCDELIIDLDDLFQLLRLYDKEKIYFIALNNNDSEYYDEIYDYLNIKIKSLCSKYNIILINDKNDDRIANKIIKNK